MNVIQFICCIISTTLILILLAQFNFAALRGDKLKRMLWISGAAILGYCLASGLDAVVADNLYSGFHVLKYAFLTLTPFTALFFSLRLNDFSIADKKWFSIPIAAFTAADIILLLTNPFTHLMYRYNGHEHYGATYLWGPLFPVHIVVCYFISIFAVVNFMIYTVKHGKVSTRVASASILLPICYNLLFTFFPKVFRIDLTAVLYSVVFVIFAFSLYRDSLFGMSERVRELYINLILHNYPANGDFIIVDEDRVIKLNTNHASEFSIGRKYANEEVPGLDYIEYLREILGEGVALYMDNALTEIFAEKPGTSLTRTYHLDVTDSYLSTQLTRFGATKELHGGAMIIHTNISETYESLLRAKSLAWELSARERYLSLLQLYTPDDTTIILCDDDRVVRFTTANIVKFAPANSGLAYTDIVGMDYLEGIKNYVTKEAYDIAVDIFEECDRLEYGVVVSRSWLIAETERYYTIHCVKYAPTEGVHGGYLSVINDVTELNRSKLEAEAASTAKSSFLSNISHEIRTPMNAIIGMTALAMKEDVPEKVRLYLNNTSEASNRLLNLINDVLDISKIESGKMELVREDFDFCKMMMNSINVIAPLAKEKNITLDTPKTLKFTNYLISDELRLSQIIVNLLSNAVKFTPEGGTVSVRGTLSEDNRLSVAVSDTGIGIAPENLEKLFDSFEQADTSITRRFGGSGLGLAISKKISELMEGDLTVISEVGKGSTFTISIPAKFGGEIIDAESDGGEILVSFKGKQILVTEDVEVNRLIVSALLEDSGCVIDEAENGEIAVKLVEENSYDLILMDMQMPVMDGLTATREIRAFNKTIPIIAMTANAFKEDENRCKEAGMNDHISKPIDADKFLRVLSGYLR
ncbi:MAG: response regulator [Ruminococcus sp.]|jgi:signal transduction histidine kinase/CheY-like chemotaxis protein|nr:response regulator [Ruminococcus sp.]